MRRGVLAAREEPHGGAEVARLLPEVDRLHVDDAAPLHRERDLRDLELAQEDRDVELADVVAREVAALEERGELGRERRRRCGHSATSASEIPWMRVDSRGILTPGFTRRSSVATSPPFPKRTTATSTTRSVSRSVPVVSRSKTASGLSPQSSKSGARASRGRASSVTPGSWPNSRGRGGRRLPRPRAARGARRVGPDEAGGVEDRRGRPCVARRVVERVAEERRPEVREMDAQLVHPARLGRELDEGRFAAILEDPVGRARLPPGGVDGRAARAAGSGGIAPTRRPDRRCPRARARTRP